MPNLDDFQILLNPSTDYFDKIINDIVRDQGWSICRSDYDIWLTTLSKYWLFVAVEKGSKDPIASVALALDEFSATGEPLFAMGMYYCNPKYRGIGLGSKLFDTAMSIPPRDSNVTLVGVITMSGKYKNKYGFSHIGLTLVRTTFYCKDVQKVELLSGITTKDVAEVSWSDVNSYENTVNPRPHPNFLKKLLLNEGSYSRIAYDSSGIPIGIMCIRIDIASNISIGPLYAENQDAALALLSTTLAMIDLSKYGTARILYPESNKDAEKVASLVCGGKHKTVVKSNAQFTKKIVEIPQRKIYSTADIATGFM